MNTTLSGNQVDQEEIWNKAISVLQSDLASQQFCTWIQPLQLSKNNSDNSFRLIAPNRFIKDWVNDKYLTLIENLLVELSGHQQLDVSVDIQETESTPSSTSHSEEIALRNSPVFGNSTISTNSANLIPLSDEEKKTSENVRGVVQAVSTNQSVVSDYGSGPELNLSEKSLAEISDVAPITAKPVLKAIDNLTSGSEQNSGIAHQSNIIPGYNFKTFVEGKSNQLARAAAMQVAENPGDSYNPLFLYGGVGLGKTHLMHAVGNALLEKKPGAKVVYLHSERFVADMVKALQLNAIDDFKRFYRSVDALLIDDIQFFANKERSQEEFFHTFNNLLQEGKQIILTCDKYPKEIKGLEERLKSRFGWGLTVAVEPPELETRVAILMKKAEQANMDLSKEAAFFIAQRLRSNVRELEGALKRVIAQAHFKARPIDIDLIKESLKDLLSLQDRLVSIDNIQKTVAEYYKIKVSDLLSKRRNRSVARPRQVAMSLAKELTSHSLPEIGDAFGGRDHTTVLHACRKIEELKESNNDIQEDVKNLLRTLTS